MKKITLFLIPALILAGCDTVSEENDSMAVAEDPVIVSSDPVSVEALPVLTVVPNGEPSEAYKEIETNLTTASFDSGYYLDIINQEIERLQKEGQVFWHNSDNLFKDREVMHKVQVQNECKVNKEKCSIVGLTSMPKFLPPNFKTADCLGDTSTTQKGEIQRNDGSCVITEPEYPKSLLNSLLGLGEIYAGQDGNYYIIGAMEDDGQYTIYKNEEPIFTSKMYFSPIGATEEAAMVLDSPAFTFNSDQVFKISDNDQVNQVLYTNNIFYKGETLNEKNDLDGSSHLFAYKDKLGLVGRKDDKRSLFFNGQKISEDFDKIITQACCMIFAYPIQVDENGILFFMAERGGKYYFVEVNLNEYL